VTAESDRVTGPEITTLDSGVRVVTEHVPGVRSVALGFWIGTGSVTEKDTEAGLSHLLEHMLFRGTERYGSEEIDQIFDSMGAELNAGTGKEMTSVHARVLDRNLAQAFDVIGDMVWRPRMDELENEREVVLEEIAMYEDDPQDRVFDVLGEAVFGGHPLGRAILGRADVVSAADQPSLQAFHAARYKPENVVVAAAGSVDHAEVVEWTRKAAPPAGADRVPGPPPPPDERLATPRFRAKETEQYHVCLGGPGLARDDDRRFALRVLDNLLGGTSSSRLFQAVRERRGLAYSVFSFHSLFAGTGQVGVYVGTREENLEETMRVIGGELEQISLGRVQDAELKRAKDNVQGRVVLALESTTARMDRIGAAVLADLPMLSIDELIERIDAVTADDIQALANEFFLPSKLSAAGIGPDGALFAQALEPINPKLAGIAHLHAGLV
jgi:predicted Zn-dependent peptidase